MAYKIDSFIPEIWAAELLITKEKNLVYGALANRNYEGSIRNAGDRVRISQVGNINVVDYVKNSTALTPDYLTDAQLFLDIDQDKHFIFEVDDLDKAQTNINFLSEAMRKAGYKLNDTVDQFLAGLYGGCVITQNSSNSPVDCTSTNVENQFLTVAELMNNNNAPMAGRFAVIPPWILTKITLAGIKSLTDNTAEYSNGSIGRAFGFDMYISNNVNKDSTAWADSKIICGIKGETFTFAEQLLQIETLRSQSRFSNIVRGRHVYGGRILQADVSACLFADKTDET
jgi:hypothetical protein